jgi:hypothetical protein
MKCRVCTVVAGILAVTAAGGCTTIAADVIQGGRPRARLPEGITRVLSSDSNCVDLGAHTGSIVRVTLRYTGGGHHVAFGAGRYERVTCLNVASVCRGLSYSRSERDILPAHGFCGSSAGGPLYFSAARVFLASSFPKNSAVVLVAAVRAFRALSLSPS